MFYLYLYLIVFDVLAIAIRFEVKIGIIFELITIQF